NMRQVGTAEVLDPRDSSRVELWDLAESRRVALPEGTRSAILGSDGRTAVAAAEGEIVVLDISTGRPVHRWKAGHASGLVSLSSDGKRVISCDSVGDSSRLHLWNVETGIKANSFPGFSAQLLSA